MKVVTSEQMQTLERRAVEVGIPTSVLMENAGLAVAKEVWKLQGNLIGKNVLVLIGPGNNGGDGLVAARHLHKWGARVDVYLCFPRPRDDMNLRLVQDMDISITDAAHDVSLASLGSMLVYADVVIDAIFGTGKSRPLEGVAKEALEWVRQAKADRPELFLVALDIPSGLNPDTGVAHPACPQVDITITLACPKLGLYTAEGGERTGRVIVADIGIPKHLDDDILTDLLDEGWVASVLPERPRAANKGTFGRALVVAGSINYIGAAYLACMGALRVGAGLVTLATPKSLVPILASKLTEVTFLPLPESQEGVTAAEAAHVVRDALPTYDALLVGCGLGQHASTLSFIQQLLLDNDSRLPQGLVLDADALSNLAKVPSWWQSLERNAILTPHPGEMSRLTGLPVPQVQQQRLSLSRKAAAEWDKIVVLKGAFSMIADPQGWAKISPFANAGLASAGTGDIVAGVILGLLAQGVQPFEAAACGVYLHSAAGEMVRERLGDAGMIAGDLLPCLPRVIRSLKEKGMSLQRETL